MSSTDLRIVKRYANRKLYDTRDSRYVTLDQISAMIRHGEDVQVVDNNTKDDLTSVTLAQIIFEQEKRKRSFLPLSALRKIVERGGEQLQEFSGSLQDLTGRVFQRKEGEGEGDGDSPEVAAPVVAEKPASEGRPDPAKLLRELVEGVQGTMDEWQRRVGSSIQTTMDSVSPLAPLQREILALRGRIKDLEHRLKGGETQ